MRALLCVWFATALAACAQQAAGSDPTPTARRLYTAGEQRLAEGRPEEAIRLWRGAITQLPATEEYDDLRHKLVLRLAYGHLLAYQDTGRLAYLFDAKTMLDLYVLRHEALFGDGPAARAARGWVYEVLFEIESRIETPPLDVAAASAEPFVDAADATQETDVQEVTQGDHRVVVVRRRGLADIDDPALRRALVEWNPRPDAPSVLTRPGQEPWVPARAYVRLDGTPTVDDGAATPVVARTLAGAMLTAARPALRQCYEDAFARRPAAHVTVGLRFSITAAGVVADPTIVRGSLGDPAGDACMLEHLRGARLEGDAPPEEVRLDIDLMFFYAASVQINESTGRAPTVLDPPPEDPAAEAH